MKSKFRFAMFGILMMFLAARTSSATTATGGSVSQVGAYVVHTFTNGGAFTVTAGGSVDVLIVAGGGGGGTVIGGGGGAGGLLYTNSLSVSAGPIDIAVGTGGAGSTDWGQGGDGGNSSFGLSLIAYGGGGGGGWNNGPGRAGGSGGGSAHGDGTMAAPTSGQGNLGGASAGEVPGGGGGAGSAGANGAGATAGNGGAGLAYDISGALTWYAGGGGGGGGNSSGTRGTGGNGGGGAGGPINSGIPGTAGTPGTGGGGGGGSWSPQGNGGNGGSGIVIVRYLGVLPVIDNLVATNVSSTSATLGGYLSWTGGSPATVSVYWGTSDGGMNKSAWSHTNDFGVQGTGLLSTNIGFGVSGTTYYYRFYAMNGAGETWASSSASFIAGNVTIAATTPTVSEAGADPGRFTVTRPVGATADALTVNYTISGSAINGVDYLTLANSVTIPAGASSATITLTPILDLISEGTENVVLTLASGAYMIGAPNFATVNILDAGTVNVFTNAGGYWHAGANWSLGHIPTDGENVAIAANVQLTNATAALASYTLSASITNTFSGGTNTVLTATDVTIDGTITCVGPFIDTDPTNAVSIACNALRIDHGGVINVDGKGYAGAAQAQGPTPSGYGPGGGSYGKFGGWGGGHGGLGGTGGGEGSTGVNGAINDSTNAPMNPGSGGGGSWFGSGVAGGGAVRIAASGRVTINGSISANGVDASGGSSGGAGSGGAVYIACHVFGGATDAVMRAKGGSASDTASVGGGGGGRIAVVFDSAAQSLEPKPHVQLATDAGTGKGPVYAGHGTIFFPDAAILDGAWMPYTGIVLSPGSSWAPATLNLNGWFLFTTPGASLTVSNALTISGSGARLVMPEGSVVNCGSITLTNGGSMDLSATVTNEAYGVLVSAAGDIDIESNSWINLSLDGSTNGAAARLTMRNLTIQSGAGINADGKGYAGGLLEYLQYPVWDGVNGSGPGGGAFGKFGAPGGSYGGVGGIGAGDGGSVPASSTYGSTNLPVDPGSGGGGSWGNSGGRGGGAVQIVSDGRVTVNGTITANGAGSSGQGGGGSGGGIYIICNRFGGSSAGIVSAKGGIGSAGGGGGGGGGGRIAVQAKTDTFTGEAPGTYVAYAGSSNGCISVNSGTGFGSSTNGTFFLQMLPKAGLELSIQ